jgi:hypothetical protein
MAVLWPGPWTGIAVGSASMFSSTPGWTRLDSGISGLRCSSVSIRRGRQSVWERTETGTASATFNDRAGALDPTNTGSLISKPFGVAIRNPVTGEWSPLFRGVVDDVAVAMNRDQQHLEVTIQAVDMFDYFANFELIPGLAGFANAQLNRQGYVFYEDASYRDRILAILGDAQLTNPDYISVFSGNIDVSECQYSAGDKVMQALEEAVDAEFPTVANHYVDVRGVYQAHGRLARFTPDTIAAQPGIQWDFKRWKVGDNAAAKADTTRAKMQEPYTLSQSRAEIRNAALCYPINTDQQDLNLFIYTDEASRSGHGTRTWTAPNLTIKAETTLGLTAKSFCQKVSQYIVQNYGAPVARIPQVTVGSARPTATPGPLGDNWGPAVWDYICGVDISDVVNVAISHPGGGGGAGDYYVEGVTIDIRPGPGSLDNAYPLVTHTVDLSSSDHWATNPFV